MRRVLTTSPATLIAVLFATALVTCTAVIHAGVSGTLERAVRTATADADVVVSASEPLPLSLAEEIRALPGVAAVTEQTAGIAFIDDELGAAIGVQSLIDPTLFTLTDGHMPTSDNEAVIVENAGEPTRYLTGATIALKGDGGESEPITIVGTATAAPGATEEPSLSTLVTTHPAAQRLLGLQGDTRLLVHTQGSADEVHAAVADVVANSGTAVSVDKQNAFVAANVSKYASGTRTLMLALRLLAAVALLAAVVVIGNNYRLQLARSTREVALLRSIGALRRQVFTLTLTNAATAGVIGSVGGVVLGVVVGAVVLKGLPESASEVGFWVRLVLFGLCAGVIPSVLAALRPTHLATRVAPVEALRRAEPVAAGTSRVRCWAGLVLLCIGVAVAVAGGVVASLVVVILGAVFACAGLLLAAAQVFTEAAAGLAAGMGRLGGQNAAQAGSQLRRNPARSGATALAVWIATTLMTALLIGNATAQATLAGAIEGATPMDISATPGVEHGADDLAAQIAQLPEVAASAPITDIMLDAAFAAAPESDGPMTVAAWSPHLVSVLATDATIPEPAPGTIILPPTPATIAGSGGSASTVTLHQPGASHEFAVTIVDGAPLMGIVHPADLEHFTGVTRGVWVKLAPGVDPLDGMDAIAQLPGVATVSSPAVQRLEANAELRQLATLGLAFLAVALLIAVVGLSNTVALSVAERIQEIGLLRALGALRVQITRMILAETVLLAAAAGVIGIAFGALFGVAASHALLGGEQLYVVTVVPWIPLTLLAVALLAAAALAALLPARRAASIPPVAALAQ